MPDVARVAGDVNEQEGFVVTTETGSDEYEYHLELRGDDAVCTKRYIRENGGEPEELEPSVTETVRETMAEYGFDATA